MDLQYYNELVHGKLKTILYTVQMLEQIGQKGVYKSLFAFSTYYKLTTVTETQKRSCLHN